MKSLLITICAVLALSGPAFAQDEGGGDGQDGGGDQPSAQATTDNPFDAAGVDPDNEALLVAFEAACPGDYPNVNGTADCVSLAAKVCSVSKDARAIKACAITMPGEGR